MGGGSKFLNLHVLRMFVNMRNKLAMRGVKVYDTEDDDSDAEGNIPPVPDPPLTHDPHADDDSIRH